MKKRILVCNEASFMNSGYANYGRELLSGLHASSKYEIAELGCYATVEDTRGKKLPWKFYPNAVTSKDPRYEKYMASASNQFGFWRFDLVCVDFKPDIVIDVRDPWMFEYQSFSPLRDFFSWIIMPPIDSAPQKNEWLNTFSGADKIIPYTNWAKNILQLFAGRNLHDTIAPAGVDGTVFRPLDSDIRKRFNIDKDALILGAVMRNQRRKLIPNLLEALVSISAANSNTMLYLHTTYPELAGWDIPKLLVEHQVVDKVLFTYVCKKCKNFQPSKFRGIQTHCEYCNNFSCVLSGTGEGVNTEQLNEIYNIFDIFIQYAICEGFGIPQIEAGACGIPVCSVDYTAMSEVVRNIGGHPIKTQIIFHELESQALRAYPDNEHLKKSIIKIINTKNLDTVKNNIREATLKHYSWKKTIDSWINAIESVDINLNKSWRQEKQFTLPQVVDIDYSLSPFNIAKYICDTVLHSKDLLYTEFMQKLIRDADATVIKTNGLIQPFTKDMMVQRLQQYANHKVFIDDIRVSDRSLTEDFITYHDQ